MRRQRRVDASAVICSHGAYGGDGRALNDQLRSVQFVQGFEDAFAAFICDGYVAAWGSADSMAVLREIGACFCIGLNLL